MQKKRALALLFSAHIVSNFASGITMLAIPWFLVSKMDMEQENVLIQTVVTFLTIFWGVYAGTLIDRYNRKRIFQVQQFVAFGVLAGAAWYGHTTGELPLLLIAAGAGITIFSWSIYYNNLYAFVQEMFEPEYYKRVNAGIETIGQITNFVGMLVGSVLLAGSGIHEWWPEWLAFEAWSLSEIFLLDGCTYLLSMLIISLIRYTPGDYLHQHHGGVIPRLIHGYRYLRARPALIVFGICSYMIFFALLVFVHAAMPMYVNGHMGLDFEQGALVVAEFEAVYSIGAIVTGLLTLFTARLLQRSNLIRQVTFLLFLMGGVFFTMSFTNSIGIFLLLGFLTGIGNSGARILRITYLVRIVPNEVIGRVNSWFRVVNVTSRFLMLFLLTLPFFGGGNVIYALMILGALCAASGVLLVIYFPKFDQSAAYG